MANRLFHPNGTPYNFEDPLGLIEQEKSDKLKAENPNIIQDFLETEAKKKDELRRFRLERPTYHELRTEFAEVVRKLINMAVRFKYGNTFLAGKIKSVQDGVVQVMTRGKKKEFWLDFDEILSLRQNYN